MPDEEYFYLSVLALKTIHLETQEEAEYVNEINSRKLYLQAKQLNIPFHKWYTWLESRFVQLKQVHDEELK